MIAAFISIMIADVISIMKFALVTQLGIYRCSRLSPKTTVFKNNYLLDLFVLQVPVLPLVLSFSNDPLRMSSFTI